MVLYFYVSLRKGKKESKKKKRRCLKQSLNFSRSEPQNNIFYDETQLSLFNLNLKKRKAEKKEIKSLYDRETKCNEESKREVNDCLPVKKSEGLSIKGERKKKKMMS